MKDWPVLWWLLRAAFCFGLLLVAWLSLATHVPIPAGVHVGDKVGHLLAYAALGFTATALVSTLAKFAMVIAISAFGVAMEAGQATIPGRTEELADLAANSIGLALGLLCALAFERLVMRRLRSRARVRPAYAALRSS